MTIKERVFNLMNEFQGRLVARDLKDLYDDRYEEPLNWGTAHYYVSKYKKKEA